MTQAWAEVMRKPIRPDHVAIYIRWSTEEQGEGTTETEQRETCEAYVKSQGWRCLAGLVFVDAGYSGGTVDRPALSRLRDLVAAGEVDCVCAMKVDRLSRSVRDIVSLVLGEWEGRCYFRSAREPIDTTTQVGKFAFYLLASFSEWERETIRERTLGGKIRRAKEGHHLVRPPFGYRMVQPSGGGRPVREVVPEQAVAVRQAFLMAAQGLGRQRIARWLNEHGLRTTQGNLWQWNTAHEMLTNPVYCGLAVYGRKHRNPAYKGNPAHQTYSVKDPNPIIAAGGLPAIITQAEFDAAQTGRMRYKGRQAEGMTKPRGFNRAVSSRYLLTGLLHSWCTSPSGEPYSMTGMVCRDYRSSTRCETLYYICSGYHDSVGGSHRECPTRTVRVEKLDAIVVGEFLKRYGSSQLRPASVRRIIEQEAGHAVQLLHSRRTELEQKQAAAQRRLRRFTDDYGSGELSAHRFEDLSRDCERELEAVGVDLSSAKAALAKAQAVAARHDASETECSAVDQWDSLTTGQQKELLRAALVSVTVCKSAEGELQVDILFRGGP